MISTFSMDRLLRLGAGFGGGGGGAPGNGNTDASVLQYLNQIITVVDLKVIYLYMGNST